MSFPPGSRRIVVSTDDPHGVLQGDCVFVERPGEAASGFLTYGDLLTAADCASIDDQAYADARAWYRLPDGSDRFYVDGIAYGAATEYAVTEALVRYYRARTVLERLSRGSDAEEVELRALGTEWQLAADALGLRFTATEAGLYRRSPSGLASATLPERLLSRLRHRSPRPGAVVLMGAPRWSIPYYRLIARSWGVHLVDPGLRVLAWQLSRAAADSAEWLSDAERNVTREASVAGMPEGGLPPILAAAVHPLLGGLPAWVRAGAHAALGGARVAVAPQDTLPATRAYLIGFKAGGGRIVTLEHGVAGSFRNQIHSVANILAIWGASQERYHRQRQPMGLRFELVGSARMSSFWAIGGRPSRGRRWDLLFFAQPTTALSAGSWPADEARAIRLVEEYARRNPRRRVALKLHPATLTYGGLVPADSPVERVRGDALNLISSAKVVVVVTSTAGIEAMAAGVPVLELRPTGPVGEPSFISQSGATAVARTYEQFEAGAGLLLTNGAERARAARTGREYAYEFVRGIDQPGLSERLLCDLVASESEPTS